MPTVNRPQSNRRLRSLISTQRQPILLSKLSQLTIRGLPLSVATLVDTSRTLPPGHSQSSRLNFPSGASPRAFQTRRANCRNALHPLPINRHLRLLEQSLLTLAQQLKQSFTSLRRLQSNILRLHRIRWCLHAIIQIDLARVPFSATGRINDLLTRNRPQLSRNINLFSFPQTKNHALREQIKPRRVVKIDPATDLLPGPEALESPPAPGSAKATASPPRRIVSCPRTLEATENTAIRAT